MSLFATGIEKRVTINSFDEVFLFDPELDPKQA